MQVRRQLVQSNNTFGPAQAGSRLANTTVGLRIGGTQTLPVNIIQSPMYTRYIGMIADNHVCGFRRGCR